MKIVKAFYQVFATILLMSTVAVAQKPSTGCVDPAVKASADNIKESYAKKGMVVFQESMLAMTSMEPTPIAVRLQQGVTYEMFFAGSTMSTRLMLEIFDGADKKLDHKVEKDVSHLVYTFIPKKTEVYLITLTQKKGMKDMCGYFGIMVKKPIRSTNTKPTPERTTQPTKQTTTRTTTTTKTTTTTTQPKTNTNVVPNNQRPNPNRTRATQQHQQNQQK